MITLEAIEEHVEIRMVSTKVLALNLTRRDALAEYKRQIADLEIRLNRKLDPVRVTNGRFAALGLPPP